VEKYFILPMLHPAAALRGTGAMKMFEETFGKLPNALQKIKTEKSAEPEQKKKEQKFENVQGKLF
jgi:hypothetical protein